MVRDCYYFAAMIPYFTICHQHFRVYFLEKELLKKRTKQLYHIIVSSRMFYQ